MIDNRKLSTADVLMSGILDREATYKTRCPNVELLARVAEDEANDLRDKLWSGGIEAPMYYGCWRIWRHDGKYDGELMQYRVLTDHFENASLDKALCYAEKWYAVCYG